MKTNDKTNYAKRTANQINAILKANGIESKAENTGNGNLFCITENTMQNRMKVKKAGFILQVADVNEKTLYFNCF